MPPSQTRTNINSSNIVCIKDTTASEMKDLPQKDIFDLVGSFGPWQKRVFVFFFLFNIIGIWQNFAITFMAPNMDFTCVAYGDHPSNESEVESRNGSLDILYWNTTNQCHLDYSSGSSLNGEKTSVPCTTWEYNKTIYSQTIVSEWDLVCDREWLVSLAKSIYMVGFLMSVFIFGQFSDCYGRFPTVMICYFITCSSSLLSVFSTSYLMFIILRFLSAFGRTGLSTTGFVLLIEIVGPEWRTEIGILIQFGWCFGMMILPAISWFVKPWYWFQLAIALPIIPLACGYWIVPESPRWLMTQGKTEKFLKVMAKAAKQNGRVFKEESTIECMKQGCEKNQDQSSATKTVLDLMRTPVIARRAIYMAILWTVNAFVYYALSYNTNDLGGNPYINFFISGSMELPSYAVVFFSIRKLGRKLPLLVGMMIGGAACAGIMVVPAHLYWLNLTFAMIGKFCITGTFGLLYLYTTELFPTVARNVAIGSCSTCARVGSIIAPFVRELERATHYTVPYAINAALTIASAFLVFLLPETKDRKIPDTLEQAELFGMVNEDCSKNSETSPQSPTTKKA